LIRSILLTGLVITLTWLYRDGAVSLPWKPLIAVVGGMLAVHFLLLIRLQRTSRVSEAEFFGNMLLDIAFLTALLYLTGGSTNPLVSYFLIPLIISAAVLRPLHTWSIALLTIACYSFLLVQHRPVELFSMNGHDAMMSAHFTGMWINFTFSSILIAWFVVRMAATMREQDRAIARTREAGLRDEQIISVASIAAGTAHELRTPLSTMTVLADEMKSEHPDMEEDLTLLQGQLERCDLILRELISATADSSRTQDVTVEQVFKDLLDKWTLARPEVHIHAEIDSQSLNLELQIDPSFLHALLSFLHNAADASPDRVRLGISREGSDVLILIEDRGAGIPTEVAGSLGRRTVSHKEGGLGLGVLLSSASIERLGGEIALVPRHGGGTRLEIRMPAVNP
jgi:two-component system sensor histidine kinase RegB